jgi:hypothetical protein
VAKLCTRETNLRASATHPSGTALLMEWRAAMDKLVTEARRNGMLGAEEAANLTEVPNIP